MKEENGNHTYESSLNRDVDNIALNDDSNVVIPETLSEALLLSDCRDNPQAALERIAKLSQRQAHKQAQELIKELHSVHNLLPDFVVQQVQLQQQQPFMNGTKTGASTTASSTLSIHALDTAMASADSIMHTLLKIASGGSQASHEIRVLEQEKADMDAHIQDVQMALTLRQASEMAIQAWQTRRYSHVANAVKTWLDWQDRVAQNKANSNNSKDDKNNSSTNDVKNDERCAQYAGQYTLQQLSQIHDQLKKTLLEKYQDAVNTGNLQELGNLTPILGTINLEQQAVELYLQFLATILESSMNHEAATNTANNDQQQQQQNKSKNAAPPQPPFVPMAHVYNAAVVALRHHLPMVSQCLYKAQGDAAVVQLVHAQVEQHVLPLLNSYQQAHQLPKVAKQSQRIYALLEERYTGRSLVEDDNNNNNNNNNRSHNSNGLVAAVTSNGGSSLVNADVDDDCGFSKHIGSLADVDVSLEEAAMVVQHAERYLRFMQHTCFEVNRARELRWQHSQQQTRYERERREWQNANNSNGNARTQSTDSTKNNNIVDFNDDDEDDKEYQPLEILPSFTALHQGIAELGGQYASIERCLLLTSLQRAFSTPENDQRYYRPLSIGTTLVTSSNTSTKNGLFYNPLQTSLVEACWFAARRGPQRALATGHTGTASAVINFVVDCLNGVVLEVLSHRAEDSGVAVLKPGEGLLVGSAGIFNATNLIRQSGTVHLQAKDDIMRRKKVREDIAKACAVINDLEVAVNHCRQLENTLQELVKNGFAPGTHDTEQLSMCVKSISTVTDSFKVSADATIESLESVLKTRIRNIVGEAVGGEGAGTTMLLGSTVISGNKSTDKVTTRMDYNLDEEAYNISQLTEGYVARLCVSLDELLDPLRMHLAPRLWDSLWLMVMNTVSKRLETSIRKCEFTALGALALEVDLRDLWNFTKDRLIGSEFSSYTALARGCHALQRLLQIAKLLNVDDLDDVLDLITVHKRKGNWDLKLEETKAFLIQRVEFENTRVNELLRLSDDD